MAPRRTDSEAVDRPDKTPAGVPAATTTQEASGGKAYVSLEQMIADAIFDSVGTTEAQPNDPLQGQLNKARAICDHFLQCAYKLVDDFTFGSEIETEESDTQLKVLRKKAWSEISLMFMELGKDEVEQARVDSLFSLRKNFIDQIDKIWHTTAHLIRKSIAEKEHPEFASLSPEQRWRELERFARERGGIGVECYGKILFPDTVQQKAATSVEPPLPAEPPERWIGGRGCPETPPDFIRRVYGEWLGKGFTRATLRHLDPPLARAVDNWLRTNEMPADIDLPTLKEQNTRWVDRVEREGIAAVLPEGSAELALREGRRLATAKHRRSQKQQRT